MTHSPLRFLPLVALLLCACGGQHYRIHLDSAMAAIEGQTLHLKVFRDGQMQSIDSAQVVHGRLQMEGMVDSATMAGLFVDETCILPVVLEEGKIGLNVLEGMQYAQGTEMNDSLAVFVKAKAKLEAEMDHLSYKESQMVMDGMPHDSVVMLLDQEAEDIGQRSEALVSSFVAANYNNILGPGVFMILTSNFPYPILNPQIEALVHMGTPYFVDNPYVKEYMRLAEQNMKTLRGDEE